VTPDIEAQHTEAQHIEAQYIEAEHQGSPPCPAGAVSMIRRRALGVGRVYTVRLLTPPGSVADGIKSCIGETTSADRMSGLFARLSRCNSNKEQQILKRSKQLS
jgi:hypothetical protein